MNYFGASINTSSVVAETAGAVIENGAFCAVKYDENGDVMLCDTAGELAVGVVIPATAGKFVMGYAMTNATAENEIIEVDIRKCGYKA